MISLTEETPHQITALVMRMADKYAEARLAHSNALHAYADDETEYDQISATSFAVTMRREALRDAVSAIVAEASR